MYAVLVITVLVFMVITMTYKDDYRTRAARRFTLFIGLVLVLMAALRALSVGTDTPGYVNDYEAVRHMTFAQISSRYEGYLGYFWLSKLFALLGLPVSVWFGFVELLYVSSMWFFIRRRSEDPLFSALIFICSGLFLFSMAGMKQVLGMAVMMYSYLCFTDRRYLLSLLLGVLAFMCHPAVLVMLAGYFLYAIRRSRLFYLFVVGAVAVAVFAGEWLLPRMVSVLGNEHFAAYLQFENTYTASSLIFYLVIVGISLLGYRNFARRDPMFAKVALGFSLVACGFQSLASISPNAFRMAYLFTPYMMVLLPGSIRSIRRDALRPPIYLMALACLIVFFLYTTRNTPYEFA